MDPSLYNTLPYQGHVFRSTHPNHLAAVAILYGLTPPPVKTARILELGCANGENLIPMAYGLPDASLVGIDLASRQIDNARAIAHHLALKNITFHAADILTLDQSLGTFDYIICHGVYSWVPENVRKKILDLCQHNLSPNGVAYISYNVYPGWHMRMIVRDMVLYHTRQFDDPFEKVAQARAYLDFLAASVFEREGPLVALLNEMIEFLNTKGDYYLLHEYLEPFNVPLHFYQFAQQIAEYQLDYLTDADSPAGFHKKLSPELTATLGQITPDFTAYEQHLDFMRARAFRKSLIIHNRSTPIPRRPVLDSLRTLLLSASVYPVLDRESAAFMPPDHPRLFSDDIVQFLPGRRSSQDSSLPATLSAADPLLKNALVILFQHYPDSLSLADLTSLVRQRVREKISPQLLAELDHWQRLAIPLLQCLENDFITILSIPHPMVTTISNRPATSAIARFELTLPPVPTPTPSQEILLTTLHHFQTPCTIPPEIISLADGTRSHPQIIDALMAAGPKLPDGSPATREHLESLLSRAFQWLSQNALLIR